MRLISGDAQTGTAGGAFPQPIIVEVLDSAGHRAWGRPIFSQLPDTAVTGSDGRAVLTLHTGTVAGPAVVVVQPMDQALDAALQLTLHLTVLAGPLDHFTISPRASAAGPPRAGTAWLTTQPILRDDLLSPRDTFDNVAAWPAGTTFSLATGWKVSGDTIVPPSPDWVGTTTVGVQASGHSATATFMRVDDLRTHRWNASFSCGAPGTPANEHLGSGALTDSLDFAGTVRVIAYPGDSAYYVWPSGTGEPPIQAYLQGTFTRHVHGGGADTTVVSNYVEYFADQRPDSLVFPYQANTGPATGAAAVTQPGPLPRYVGGSWCDPALFSVRPSVVMTAY